ncbi:hypothetical protein [Streptomyces sp. NPDC059092]|uniref:hypothetical protein n=1 Tax=Streptomyces sp. NPDC059092 TaxID=3346725 RepID=UPI0036923805
MTNVTYFRASGLLPYQAPDTTVAWNLNGGWGGDGENYWGYSARPNQANASVTAVSVTGNQDNNLSNSTDIVTTMRSYLGVNGGLIRFAAIRVTP